MPQILGIPALFDNGNIQEYWTMENTVGNKNSFTLTNVNSVEFNPAKYGNGADFGADNNNKYLSLATNLNYVGVAYSILLIYKRHSEISSEGDIDTLISIGNAFSKTKLEITYSLLSGIPTLNFTRTRLGVVAQTVTLQKELGVGVNYLALTFDDTTITGYVNGVNIGTASANGVGTNTTSDAIGIGYDYVSGGYFASGIIDEVALFNACLTEAQVRLPLDRFSGAVL